MDTKLKKSKQIRAMIYRAVSFGLLIMTILSMTTGYKALKEVFLNQHVQLLWGDPTGVTEFQQYICKIYNDGMIAYAGVGDDQGYPLEDSGSSSIQDQATKDFYAAVFDADGALLYYVYDYAYRSSTGSAAEATNFTQPIFSEYDRHLILPEGVRLLYHTNGPEHTRTRDTCLPAEDPGSFYKPNQKKAEDIEFVLAINTAQLKEGSGRLTTYIKRAETYETQLKFCIISAALLVVSWIFCLATTRAGKAAKANTARFTKEMLLEIKLVVLVCLIFAAFPALRHPFLAAQTKELIRTGLLAMVCYPIWVDLRINKGAVFERFLPVLFFRWMKEWEQSQTWRKKLGLYAGIPFGGSVLCQAVGGILLLDLRHALQQSSVGKRGIAPMFVTAGELKGVYYTRLIAAIVLVAAGLVLLAAAVHIILKFIREASRITGKLSDIRSGNLQEPLKIQEHAFLSQTAEDLNQLESGIETAVEQKSRADRMKVELITNVSHDLKTPLTSIINYADLLSEEEMSPAAKEYVTALREKSYKLKSMVQDVFEVSKASTGNLTVEKTILDLGKLIRQTLADMEERIAQTNLTFKVSIPAEPVYIEGDGERLYRVFQNLFDNAIQYSLEYSRVHVGLTVSGQKARATVKNTSKGELDFDTAEIMERFVRADASRTTDGSGLGLSIAKSFAEACGGEFSIETDADMFTAIVEFTVTEKPEVQEEANL